MSSSETFLSFLTLASPFPVLEDCLNPSTDGARVVAEHGTALLLAASNWVGFNLPPTLLTGASTVTGARLAALILSLAEAAEVVEVTVEVTVEAEEFSGNAVEFTDGGLTLAELALALDLDIEEVL